MQLKTTIFQTIGKPALQCFSCLSLKSRHNVYYDFAILNIE